MLRARAADSDDDSASRARQRRRRRHIPAAAAPAPALGPIGADTSVLPPIAMRPRPTQPYAHDFLTPHRRWLLRLLARGQLSYKDVAENAHNVGHHAYLNAFLARKATMFELLAATKTI